MEQENVKEDKIVNMSFFPRYFDWFTMHNKKFQLIQQRVAPCKEIHDSLGFSIPHCGLRIPGTGVQIPGTEVRIPAQRIPDSQKGWIPIFFPLDSGFQSLA